jgi:hypothetical protein
MVLMVWISGVIVQDGSLAGGLQSLCPKRFGKADDTLGSAQIVEYPMGKELFDQSRATRADGFRLFQTPLRVVHEIGNGLGRQMILNGRLGAWFMKSGMDGLQLIVPNYRNLSRIKCRPNTIAHLQDFIYL